MRQRLFNEESLNSMMKSDREIIKIEKKFISAKKIFPGKYGK